ncbi:MAG: FG-GAP-like repeat-containing protein, partial [Acidobacteriota bacterium]|nr:FG-GAP-like repeat-containing protein [Acidobacteriota bacterium]
MSTKPVSTSFHLVFRLLCAGIITSGGLMISSASEERLSASRISIELRDPRSPELRLSVGAALPRDPTRLPGLALASADFDEDGVPDLVTGFGDSSGSLSVRRGNIDAIYPNSPEAKARRATGEFRAEAFLPATKMIAVPEAVDFVGAGDFDADGHWDIVAAHRNGTKLYWFRGDGRGNFGPAQAIDVGGAITAFATGDINRADGLIDLVVGIVAADGPHVLIFESPDGALRGAPENFSLAAPASDLAIAQLDDTGWWSLAIASGHEVVVIHGRDRKLSFAPETQATPPPAAVSRRTFESPVLSITAGDFSGDARAELAVLTAGGSMMVLEREGQSEGNIAAFRIAATTQVGPGQRRLVATKTSSSPKDDLLVFGGSKELQIVTTANSSGLVADTGRRSIAGSIIGAEEITAVLPMRLNGDALSDLVVLDASNSAPSILTTTSGATYVVNIAGDTTDKTPGDGICADADGNCSFKAALQESNAHPGADTINFNIPGSGVPVITLTDGYQTFTDTVTIDGTTQSAGRVEIAAGFSPIQIDANNCVVRGLATYAGNFAYGVRLRASNCVIEGNYIGFKANGTKPNYGDYAAGVLLDAGGTNNLIGGTTAQARNIISNCNVGIYFGNAGPGTVIRGNYIGTNPAGTAAFGNNYATYPAGPTLDITLGGSTAGAGNVISASVNDAFIVNNAALIQGNFFGTTADGMQPLANGSSAITLQGSKPVTIGGTTPAARNVIAASGSAGIQAGSPGSTLIQGNFIGTNAAGSGALPNVGVGVALGSSGIVLGGTTSGAGNLISGNGDDGVRIVGIDGSSDNIIQGNLIGTDVSGTLAIPNQGDGVEINAYGQYGSERNLVGGTATGAGNVISGNRFHGINVVASPKTYPNRVEGNLIGVNRFGTGSLGNGEDGVLLVGTGNTIGGTDPGAGNTIAHNGQAGIGSNSDRDLIASILSNSIFSNIGLGIDRGDDGVTPYAADTYAQAPVLASATTSSSGTAIAGRLRTWSATATQYTIQFFSNSTLDPTGYGEGETFVGQTTLNVPQYTVDMPFSATVTPAVPAGRFITAV